MCQYDPGDLKVTEFCLGLFIHPSLLFGSVHSECRQNVSPFGNEREVHLMDVPKVDNKRQRGERVHGRALDRLKTWSNRAAHKQLLPSLRRKMLLDKLVSSNAVINLQWNVRTLAVLIKAFCLIAQQILK